MISQFQEIIHEIAQVANAQSREFSVNADHKKRQNGGLISA